MKEDLSSCTSFMAAIEETKRKWNSVVSDALHIGAENGEA